VRLAGGAVAAIFENVFAVVSKNLAHAVAHKIRQFHSGLDTMRSFGDFAAVTGTSVSMWLLITLAYFATCRAFPDLPAITAPKCVLLMVASGTASVFQLPVLGWFSQIGLVAVAISGILGAGAEVSTACAATLLLITFLGVVPIGLVWAQFEHINLRKVTLESERAGEVVTKEEEAADSTVAP
jgi:glycosyltransferase 2 family protein